MKKLTPAQQELLDAMKAGEKVYFMPYKGRFNPHAYYFRHSGSQRCTRQVEALLKAGLLEKYDQAKYDNDHKVRVKP